MEMKLSKGREQKGKRRKKICKKSMYRTVKRQQKEEDNDLGRQKQVRNQKTMIRNIKVGGGKRKYVGKIGGEREESLRKE